MKAIVSTCGTEQRYPDDIHYRGGCLIADQFIWGMQWQVIMRAPPDPAVVGADHWRAMWQQRLEAAVALSILWNEHQTLDAEWKVGSIQDYYGSIRCAIYNVGGMLDCYLPSVGRHRRTSFAWRRSRPGKGERAVFSRTLVRATPRVLV